jgi:FemAB-related protein (PEP-CTERM system-associated)
MRLAARSLYVTTPTLPLTVTAAVSGREWDTYVESHPHASRYHLWAWRRIFEDSFDLESIYLAARRGTTLAGVLPMVVFRSRLFGHFAVSLPFVDHGGVCADDEATERQLIDHAAAAAHDAGLSYVELRHVTAHGTDLPARRHKVDMRLRLQASTDAMWGGLDRKVRNQVRKAEKSGLVARAGGPELVQIFYDVFACNMRDLGTPVAPRRFFANVLGSTETNARVHLIEHEGRAVAAAIALTRGDEIAVPWAASHRAYRHMCPNNLLYWRMIEHAIDNGLTRFNFGRSTPDQGTFHFKRQWGAEPTPLTWEYCLAPGVGLPNLSPSNPRFEMAIAVWKRLPVALTRALGPTLARSLP